MVHLQHNRIKNPTGRRQPVGYLQMRSRIWTWQDWETLIHAAVIGMGLELGLLDFKSTTKVAWFPQNNIIIICKNFINRHKVYLTKINRISSAFSTTKTTRSISVTVHGRTCFNAYPLNGQNRWSSVSCPLESFLKNVRGVNRTVSFKRHSVRTKSLPVSQSSISVSR